MPDVMMMLGDYQFSIRTAAYEELRRKHEWRWKPVKPVGRMPKHHFLGPDEGTVSLSGTIHPHYLGGLGQIDDMRAVADRGEPQMLVDGMGKVWGHFVVMSLEETHRDVTAYGAPLTLEFRLELTETDP